MAQSAGMMALDAADDAQPLVWESFLWGLLSALSLQIGSVVGVTCLPSRKVRAVLMSFGGGALLFALSIELFGHVLHRSEVEHSTAPVWAMEGSAIVGGVFFALLNHLLNVLGADLRKPSTTKPRFARLRALLLQRLANRLWKIELFSVLSLREVKDLVETAMYKERFSSTDIIMSSETRDIGIFFIISGKVRMQILGMEYASPRPEEARTDEVSVAQNSWDLGPNQIFGDLTVLTGSYSKALAVALEDTKVLVLPGREVAQLLRRNDAMRNHVSLRAVERLRQVSELRHMQEDSLAWLSARCRSTLFQPGDVIFQGVVDETTPVVCLVLGSVVVKYKDGGLQTTFHASRLLCTEHLKNHNSSAYFTATALEPTSVLLISRSDIDAAMATPLYTPSTGNFLTSGDGSERVPFATSVALPGLVDKTIVYDLEQASTTGNATPDMASQLPELLADAGPNDAMTPRLKGSMSNLGGQRPETFRNNLMSPKPEPLSIAHNPSKTLSVLFRSTSRNHSNQSGISLGEVSKVCSEALGRVVSEPPGGDISSPTSSGKGSNRFCLDREKTSCLFNVPRSLSMVPFEREDPLYLGHNLGWEDDSEDKAPRPMLARMDTVPHMVQVTDVELEEQEFELAADMNRSTSKTSITSGSAGLPGLSEDRVFASNERNRDSVPSPRGAPPPNSAGKQRAVMIWLGILIDAVPESLVIGILINKAATGGDDIDGKSASDRAAAAALPFVMGVFLSNLPESMSSAGSMKKHGMRVSVVLTMWLATTVLTAVGAAVGAVLFPPGSSTDQGADIAVSSMEGLAAGAMLTMIAQTMMPEAFEQGGDIVGLSCLAGFLCALSVKLIPIGST